MLTDRATRKPSPHTLQAYRQDFADAIATLIAGAREHTAALTPANLTKDAIRQAFAAYAATPHQPVHRHDREQRLLPGEIVPVEIELWPSSTLYRAGESLRILVKGNDIQSYPPDTFVAGHTSDRNNGIHRIHTGGHFDSHLLIPIVPSSPDRT